jgi:hypothetical protein
VRVRLYNMFEILTVTIHLSQHYHHHHHMSSFSNLHYLLWQVLAHEGVAGWYRGLPAAILKNFLTNFLFYLAHSVVKPMYKVRYGAVHCTDLWYSTDTL